MELLDVLNTVRRHDAPVSQTGASVADELRTTHRAAQNFIDRLFTNTTQGALRQADELLRAEPAGEPTFLDKGEMHTLRPKNSE